VQAFKADLLELFNWRLPVASMYAIQKCMSKIVPSSAAAAAAV
jgi:hypothetical protein